jgi:hypothetical protein
VGEHRRCGVRGEPSAHRLGRGAREAHGVERRLGVIAGDLRAVGFDVEQGKQKAGKLLRPVFFGDEGTYLRTYEIDAFEPDAGVALEVEAGRATMGNAIYRDLIQGSLMVDARFLVLAVPVEYRSEVG